MKPLQHEGEGKRVRLEVKGENYYLVATRNVDDGGIDFFVTTPEMNKPTGAARRETAERICEECSKLTRMI